MSDMKPKESSQSHGRDQLFVACSPRQQGAIVHLLQAVKMVKDDNPNSLEDASVEIQEALECLLRTSVEPRFRMASASADLRNEVFEWLASCSHRPAVLSRLDSSFSADRHRTHQFLEREPSFAGRRPEELEELRRWQQWDEFDIFQLDRQTGGHGLSTLAVHLFKHFNLVQDLELDLAKLHSYFLQIEAGYHSSLPYHNHIHAADVVHAIGWVLNLPSLRGKFQPLELCAALVAAAIHDHDHPGVNNDFLIRTSHDYALRYNDTSVLENHHAASGLHALHRVPENNFLSHFNNDRIITFRQLVISMVLATDMSNHLQLQDDFARTFNLNRMAPIPVPLETPRSRRFTMHTADRQLLLEELIHYADLANCTKPFRFARVWGERVVSEYWQQGDKELALGLTSAPPARSTHGIGKSQIAFIQHIVAPMMDLLVQKVPEMQHQLSHLTANQASWQELLRRPVDTPLPPLFVQPYYSDASYSPSLPFEPSPLPPPSEEQSFPPPPSPSQ